MPSREPPSYSSSRVQRASRLNALEQARLQQKLILLEKARLHQARLTNQDIRLTSTALEYILNSSGHSPEGRGPTGQPGGTLDPAQQEEPCFLYGERVISRKVRRMPRPHSAVERSSFRRNVTDDDDTASATKHSEADDSMSARGRLPPRPQSSPAKGRVWLWSTSAGGSGGGGGEEEGGSGGSESERALSQWESSPSRPSTGRNSPCKGRVTPHQAWEDDTDEVTKRLLKVQKLQQQQEEQLQQQQKARRYMQDIGRMRSQTSSRGFRKPHRSSHGSTPHSPPSPTPASPTPRAPSPPPAIEDRKPVPPREKRGRSAGALGKRAGLTEIMSQARATMSASAWRTHLASTQTMPRSAESQRQVIMEARRNSEKQRQQHVKHKMDSFMGMLDSELMN